MPLTEFLACDGAERYYTFIPASRSGPFDSGAPLLRGPPFSPQAPFSASLDRSSDPLLDKIALGRGSFLSVPFPGAVADSRHDLPFSILNLLWMVF